MKNLKRLLSVLMCIVMAVQVFPVGAVAEADSAAEDDFVQTETANPEPRIISEDKEKRDEYTKHFIMSDGTFMAAQYQFPIHYRDENGEWLDFDNSLTKDAATDEQKEFFGQGNVYETNNRKSNTVFAEKANSNCLVLMEDEKFPVSWNYQSAKNSRIRIIDHKQKPTGDESFLTLKNIGEEVLYENVFPDVDIQFIVGPDGTKENIILKSNKAKNVFTARYNIGNLTAKVIDEKNIQLVDGDNVVYTISAPYMSDANGEFSENLSLSVRKNHNGMLTVDLEADKEWLSSADRAFPVTVDPTVETELSKASIDSVFVASSSSYKDVNFSDVGHMVVGREATYYNYCRSLFKFTLPTLNKGDMVVSAKMSVYNCNTEFYSSTTPDMQINAHKITSAWTLDKVKWSNQPSYSSTVADYEFVKKSSPTGWRNFDISSIVKQWYENPGTNYGILLKSANESGTYAENGVKAEIWTERYNNIKEGYPRVMITYRNNKGLEDYWTYTTLSAGTAGTAYINDYTGNLVFIHGDVSTTGELMPVSLEHVYNGYMADTNSGVYPHSGRGNKLSLQQTVKSSSAYGLSGESLKVFPYAYEDSDGTVHYFYKETKDSETKYLDEDGLNLELKVVDSGYTITDKSDNVMTFNSAGNLVSISDADGRKATLTYKTEKNTAGNNKPFLSKVTDGAGHTITLTYNTGESSTNCQLTKITGPDGRSIAYSTSSGRLARIKYPDGTQSTYTYDSEGSMLTACSSDGYKLTFTYTSDGSKRVKSVTESSGTSAGQKIEFSRKKLNETVIRTAGKDSVFGNNDDILTTYQFDNFGRTIGISSKLKNGYELGAEKYDYTTGSLTGNTDIGKRNRVSVAAAKGQTVNNLLKNHSAEKSGDWTSLYYLEKPVNASDATAAIVSNESYMGEKSFKVNVTECTRASGYCMYQNTNTVLTPGSTYTFSAYVKTSDVVEKIADTHGGAGLAMRFALDDGSYKRIYSNMITGTSDTGIDKGWHRVSMTFTVPDNAVGSRAILLLYCATGTAYFDCVQIENEKSANNYNYLENSGFENSTTSWSSGGTTSLDGVSTSDKRSGNSSYELTGEATTEKYVKQTVKITGTEKDTYILSAYAKASSVPLDADKGKRFDMSVKITYSDGTYVYKRPVVFNPDVTSWQFSSGVFTLSDETSAKKTPVSITVYFGYRKQANTCYVDDISLIKEPAPTYSYDSDGNLISATEKGERNSALSYDANNNLKSFTDERAAQYTYTYSTSGNKHQLTSAVNNATGVKYAYSYYSNGNVKAQEISNKSGSAVIRTGINYTAESGNIKAGAYVLKENDQHGNSTTYDYNLKNGRLNSVTDALGNKTSYVYDNNSGVVKSVSSGGKTVSYSYDSTNTKLKQITHNGFNYSFAYDAFGNITQTKVGNQALMTNTYQANNGSLLKSTYGNGDYTEYEYNSYGQKIKEKKNGSTKYYWRYNSSENPYREIDYVNGLESIYNYDSLGRLVGRNISTKGTADDRFVSRYRYDSSNNVTKIVNKADGVRSAISYTYDKASRPTQISFGDAKINYTYDSLGRLDYYRLELGNESVLVNPVYYSSSRNSDDSTKYRTTQIKRDEIGDRGYSYTYDKVGKITNINEKVNATSGYKPKVSYSYDSLGQLKRENNVDLNKTIVYTYDNGGNIKTKKEYPYTTGTLGTATKTIIYGYDTEWKDKLTSYDGQAITYDAIGNPLTYRNGMSFTWQGRQMKNANLNGTSVSYKYNSDGLRSYKKVGETVSEYEYLGDKLVYEKRGSTQFHYRYDASGTLASIKRVKASGSSYTVYVICNSRGDIDELRNENGSLYARYVYDTWGNTLHILDANGAEITNNSSLAVQNPFRYRGYYFDSESGLYYLQSRYYDPVTGRFISADNQLSTGNIIGLNMFAYCGNDPVNRIDSTGEAWWHWALGAAVVVACAAATVITAGGFAAAAGAVAAVSSGLAAATTASTVAAGAFIGSATVYGMAVVTAASTSSSVKEFNNQGNWGTVAATAGGAVLGGGSAYVSTRTPTTKVYRSVSNAEAQDIKATGQFNLAPGGMESKQFGFDLAETRQFGNMIGQNTIVSAKVPTNMLNQFYTGGVDTSIFRSGTLTVYGDQLAAFNQAVGGTIKFMP